jgi:hypothetical protein
LSSGWSEDPPRNSTTTGSAGSLTQHCLPPATTRAAWSRSQDPP